MRVSITPESSTMIDNPTTQRHTNNNTAPASTHAVRNQVRWGSLFSATSPSIARQVRAFFCPDDRVLWGDHKQRVPTMSESGRDEKGRFAAGNRFWEARSSAGPKPIFDSPDDLWRCCVEYFEWVEDNPLLEDKVSFYQGVPTHDPIAKMRAMTVGGLCLFLDVDETTWREWRSTRPDLSPVITRAEKVIYQQKFTGAAADLLNPNIIARDLGLADKRDDTTEPEPLSISFTVAEPVKSVNITKGKPKE